LNVDVAELIQERKLDGHARAMLLPLFDIEPGAAAAVATSRSTGTGEAEEAWGWDTMSNLARPLMSVGEAILTEARHVGQDAEVQALHVLEALLQLYEGRPVRAEARAALAVSACRWVAQRIGLWGVLAPWERLAMLLAAAGLHCASDGHAFPGDPLRERVACAGRLLDVLQWSGLAADEELSRLVIKLTVRARPRCMLDDARQLRARFAKDDQLPDSGEDRALLVGLVVAAADFAFLALPSALHQSWVGLCQSEALLNPALKLAARKEPSVDIACWIWGLIDLLLSPVYETLGQAGGPDRCLEEPRRHLQENSRHWRVTPLLVTLPDASSSPCLPPGSQVQDVVDAVPGQVEAVD